MQDRFVRGREFGRITVLLRITSRRLERKAQFPRRRRIALNSVGWLESEILAWMGTRAACAGAATTPNDETSSRDPSKGCGASR